MDRDFLPGMEQAEITELLDAVGKLASLKEAAIFHAILPAKALDNFLQQAKTIEKVELGSIDLQGTPQDLDSLNETIAAHKTLKAFLMLDFSLGVSGGIDGIVKALGSTKNIQMVKLDAAHKRRQSVVGSAAAAIKPDSSVQGESLAHLVTKATSLSELHLNRLSLQLDDFQQVAIAIQDAPHLQTLGLTNVGLTDDACNELANAVAANCHLQTIDLSCNKLTDEGCTLLASALRNNHHVKLLRLWGNLKISNTGFDALVEMLEYNCVLERLPLMAPREYSTKIEAKLHQNRSSLAA